MVETDPRGIVQAEQLPLSLAGVALPNLPEENGDGIWDLSPVNAVHSADSGWFKDFSEYQWVNFSGYSCFHTEMCVKNLHKKF